jgi:hypothetical protein
LNQPIVDSSSWLVVRPVDEGLRLKGNLTDRNHITLLYFELSWLFAILSLLFLFTAVEELP